MRGLICIFCILGFACLSAVSASDIVALWDFNEGTGNVLHDRSGNANDGTIVGAKWTTGIEGEALNFDGVSSYVVISNGSSLNFTASPSFSISVWVNGTPQQVQDAGIITRGTGGNEQYCIDASLGGYRFFARDKYATVTMLESGVFPSNHWDHIVAALDEGSNLMKLYVNGVLKASQAPPSSLYQTSEPVSIGARKNIGSSLYNMPFHGTIDAIRIYNRVLSQAEVTDLYNNPSLQTIYPMLIPVASPSTNRMPILTWHSVPQAAGYSVLIDTIKSFSNPYIRTPVADTSYKVPVDLPIDTIYWQVVAGINDSLVIYSEIGSFVVQDPRVPVLIPYVPKVTENTRPSLKWYSVPAASSYTLQVAYNSIFMNPALVVPTSDTQFTSSTELSAGSIYWRVKSNLIDSWSQVDAFQIVSDSIPLLIRYDGAIVSTSRPAFRWNNVNNAKSYTFELASNIVFASPFIIPLTDSFYIPSADLGGGEWYWRVSCSRNSQLFSPVDSLDIVTSGAICSRGKPDIVMSISKIWSTPTGTRILLSRSPIGNVDLSIYSLCGKCISRICHLHPDPAGLVTINNIVGADGVYLLRIVAGNRTVSAEVLLRR